MTHYFDYEVKSLWCTVGLEIITPEINATIYILSDCFCVNHHITISSQACKGYHNCFDFSSTATTLTSFVRVSCPIRLASISSI